MGEVGLPGAGGGCYNYLWSSEYRRGILVEGAVLCVR